MNDDWLINESRLSLATPTGIEIKLMRPAIDIVAFDSVGVVLLSYVGVPPKDACQNVMAYDESGKLLWQVGRLEGQAQTPSDGWFKSPFTQVNKEHEVAELFNSAGFNLYVEARTGRILRVVQDLG